MQTRLVALLTLAVLFAMALPARADRALLVGINDYHVLNPSPRPDCRTPCLMVGPLMGAVADVKAMRHLLVGSLGYRSEDIRVLTDEAATAASIEAAIRDWLVAGTRPGERAFFHYSGHGMQAPDDNGDEADGLDEAIVPVDVRVEAQGQLSNILRDDALESAFAGLEGRIFTAVFDSCHSGTVTRSAEASGDGHAAARTPFLLQNFVMRNLPSPRSPHQARKIEDAIIEIRPGWTVWSAASADQPAWDIASPAGGFFTQHLLPALQDPDALRTLTHVQLLDRLQGESQRYCRALSKCRQLIPTLEVPLDWLTQPVSRSLLKSVAADSPDLQQAAAAALPAAGVPSQEDTRIEVAILPGARVAVGEPVRFRIRSPITGRLLVLDANTKGELVQIFPNRFRPSGSIDAERAVTIPDPSYGFDYFEAEAPAGHGQLIVVVTDGNVDLSDLVTATRGLEVIPNARDYLTEIAARLRKAYRDGDDLYLPRWAVGHIDYEIAPRR